MKADAEAHAEEDAKAKEKADKLNTADSTVFQTEKMLKESGDKLSDDQKKPIEEALTKLKAAHAAQDLDAIDASLEELQKASEALYAAAAQAEQGGAQPGPDAGEQGGAQEGGADDVQDVDFEEVK